MKLRLPSWLHWPSWLGTTRRKAAAIGGVVAALAGGGVISVYVGGGVPLPAGSVPGYNYAICNDTSQYLTSPWTYDAVAAGDTDTYTVAQYEALTGYGTTLPPLPSYIADEPSSTDAAQIFGPGASANIPEYNVSQDPEILFFEGGDYGSISINVASGYELIGGSAPGFPEPYFAIDGTDYATISEDNISINNPSSPIATIAGSSSLAPGATQFTLTASSLPIVVGEALYINDTDYFVAAVSGSQSGYTITLQSNNPIAATVAAGTDVTYDPAYAGGVTVQYLDMYDNTTNPGAVQSGADWTIENNVFDSGYMGLYDAAGPIGDIMHGGTVEYNCFEGQQHSALHMFGNNSIVAYNEVTDTPTVADNTGDSGDKWWATENSVIEDNYFTDDGPANDGFPVWLDDGNTGALIQGNYFYGCSSGCISVETGFNADINDNEFIDGAWDSGDTVSVNTQGVVWANESGGWPIPGSNYNDEFLITNNIFIDDWGNIDIWGSGQRNCQNSGEGNGSPPYDDADYCSGGYPNGDGDFSHYGYPEEDDNDGSLEDAASAGATSIVVKGSIISGPAVGDYIGFTGPGSTGYPTTTTTSTSSVTSFSGTQTLPVASTIGFPSSGQVQVGTSTGNNQGYGVGAILSYSGVGSGELTGVDFVRGSGNLAASYVNAVEPYEITAVSGYWPDQTVTISPGLAASESAGATIYNDGTCNIYNTAAALPSGPTAPDGTSYFDGCTWETKNITVSGNTFDFTASDISGGPNLWGNTNYQSCVAASDADPCGTNFMQWQVAGYEPYPTYYPVNALMSTSTFTTPITGGWNGTGTTNGGEGAWDNVWENNTYNGQLYFYAYTFGTCEAPSGYSCYVDLAQWQSEWHQD